MFIHCNRKFKSYEIWFLHNNRDFINRKLYLGICPNCGADVVEIIETRKYDGAVFRKTYYKKEAEKLTSKLSTQIDYTSNDIKKFKKVPFGLCYGENIEIHNSQGQIIEIRQKRCDYFGSKEVIYKLKPSYSS